MFGRYYTRYYNGNMYDIHRRSVWTWQGNLDTATEGGLKRIPYKKLFKGQY